MSMPLSARRDPPPANIAPFPARFAPRSEVVLSAEDTAAVSTMLRHAKSAIAALRQRAAALESDLDGARALAQAAEERAAIATACRAAEKAVARSLEENLAEALQRTRRSRPR